MDANGTGVGSCIPPGDVQSILNNRRTASLAKMREPFPANQVNYKPHRLCKAEDYDKLPRGDCKICGGYHATSKTGHLSYVGHAAITHRLLDADPAWNWDPLSSEANGEPHFDASGGLWIKLTVAGISHPGYGHSEAMKFSEVGSRTKAVISDAIRNAAMRFGAALEEWHKGELGLPDPAFVDGMGFGDNGVDSTPGKPAVVMPQAAQEEMVTDKKSKLGKSAEEPSDTTAEVGPLAEVGEVNFITKKLSTLTSTDPDKLILDTIGTGTLDRLTKANFEKLKTAIKGKK